MYLGDKNHLQILHVGNKCQTMSFIESSVELFYPRYQRGRADNNAPEYSCLVLNFLVWIKPEDVAFPYWTPLLFPPSKGIHQPKLNLSFDTHLTICLYTHRNR